MKQMIQSMVFVILFSSYSRAQDLNVFISVDMEGLTGVTHWEEVTRGGADYEYFREVMTKEANAAVEGALSAGAGEIVVRDSHGSARNILPDLLHRKAKLIRNWSGGPKVMMEGIDETFDAVIFIGYHAKAGTPDATLEHVSSESVMNMSINGISMPEAGYNALVAGLYDVPVVFVAGDKAICEQITGLLGDVETVAVKEGIGDAAKNLHPEIACERIRSGVEKALKNIDRFKPYKMAPPFTLRLTLKDESMINRGQYFPGARRTGEWELTFTANDLMEVMNSFYRMRR